MKKQLPSKLLFLLIFSFVSLITWAQTPTVDFSLDAGYKDSACGSLYLKFKNLCTNANTYEWDFGDATSKQVIPNPTHNYDKPGTYSVTLKAKNTASGITNSLTKTAFIKVFKLPSANFQSIDTLGCINHSATFTDLSTEGSGKINAWEWFFGDASKSTDKNPTKIYMAVGTYDVTFKVTDTKKCESTITKKAYITTIAKPTASFTSDTHYFCSPLPSTIKVCYNFTGTAVSPTYLWDFGDGKTDTNAAPCFTYPKTKGTHGVTLTVTSQNICSTTVTMPSYVAINYLNVDFSATTTTGCNPFTPTFTDWSGCKTGSGDNADSWSWTFINSKTKDSQTSSIRNVNNISLTDTGKFDIKLVVTTQNKCIDSTIKYSYINVSPAPLVGFIADNPEKCTTPATVVFTDTTADGLKWLWDFGDTKTTQDTSSQKSATYIYTDTGTYNVSLTVYNSNGCFTTKTKNKYIRITKPDAGFKSLNNKFDGCKNLSIDFLDTSLTKRIITKWEWDFGNTNLLSDTANTKNPTYIYTDTGEFNVYLKVTDFAGCTDSVLSPKYIQVGEPQSAGFKALDTMGCHKLTVQFIDTSNTYLGGKYIDKWNWDYGLGTAILSKGGKHKYIYVNDTGWKDVKLIVEQNGCKSAEFKNDSLVYIIPPVPRFTVDSSISCNYPYNATFTNTSIFSKKTVWDFGDTTDFDTTTTETTIDHIYKKPNFYNVTIYVFNDTIDNGIGGHGCLDTLKQTNLVKISDITPGFKQDITHICQNQSMFYTDTSIALIVNKIKLTTLRNWRWELGDGNKYTNTINTQNHTYTKSKVNTTKLFVQDDLGCWDSIIKPNNDTVFKLPVALYDADTTYGCEPLTVHFTDLSQQSDSAKIKKWLWDYGETFNTLDTSTKQNPTWVYLKRGPNGYYDVRLSIVDLRTCAKDTIISQYIKPSYPYTKFGVSSPICRYNPLVITDSTTSLIPVTYKWYFGDGDSSSLPLPTHFYKVDTITPFTITLTVTDTNTCDSTVTRSIVVSQPKSNFIADKIDFTCPPADPNFTPYATPFDTLVWYFGKDSTTYIYKAWNEITSPHYDQAGSYDITLITINKTTLCKDTVLKPKYINIDGPKGTLIYTILNGCSPLTVNFKSTSEKAKFYEWRFMDGTDTTTTIDSVAHQFDIGGYYKPRLKLYDAQTPACSADALFPTDSIAVISVETGWTIEGDSACSPDSYISLSDTSKIIPPTVKMDTRIWDLGNGKTSDKQDFDFKYDTAGVYKVKIKLKVSTCPETIDSLYIHIFNSPSGIFSFDPNKGCAPLAVTIKANTQHTNKYKWFFTPDGTDTTTTSDSIQHIFNTFGINNVSLLLSDSAIPHCNTYATPPNDSISIIKFIPGYIITGDSSCNVNDPIVLTDTSKIIPYSKNSIIRSWDLGNTETTTDSNYTFTYDTPGIYNVKVSLKVDNCPEKTGNQDIHILNAPQGSFTYSTIKGCGPLLVNLKANAQNTVKYKWFFSPDGTDTTTTTDAIQHIFKTGGINKVSLLLLDPALPHCDTLATPPVDDITVISVIPGYSITGDSACELGNYVRLIDTSKIIPSTEKMNIRIWDLGNGQVAYAQDTSFIYATAGVYTIKIKLQVNNCPMSIDSQYIHVFNKPNFNFTLTDSLGCTPVTATFNVLDNLVTDPVNTWIWDFGDKSKLDSNKTVIHTYYNDSISPIKLVAVMKNKCTYTLEKKIGFGVFKSPIAKIRTNYDTVYAEYPITFIDSSTGGVATRLWTFGDDAQATSINTQHAYKYVGSYIVNLFIESPHQCKDTIQKTIVVSPRPFIPNAFTPDQDGFNDKFMPYVQLKIVNRWGEVLYEGTDGWDGFYKSKLATSGTYYYIITIDDVMNKKPITYTGPVTLIKK